MQRLSLLGNYRDTDSKLNPVRPSAQKGAANGVVTAKKGGMIRFRKWLAIVLFISICSLPMVRAASLTGQASIIDGDTLEIHGTRIRLWGIDAPESSQLCRGEDSLQYRCGAKAANELDAFIARRPVDCSPVSLDQ